MIKTIETANEKIDTIYPWMRVVSIREGIKESTVLRVWQFYTGAIVNLRSKPGTKAAEFVTPHGILTEKGNRLVKELNTERVNFLMQTSK